MTGPYGSGKSAFALFLANLFGSPNGDIATWNNDGTVSGMAPGLLGNATQETAADGSVTLRYRITNTGTTAVSGMWLGHT